MIFPCLKNFNAIRTCFVQEGILFNEMPGKAEAPVP